LAVGMSIRYAHQKEDDLPIESRLLHEVVVRLVGNEAERRRHDELLERDHHLRNAKAVGRVLRCIAEYRGQWPCPGVSPKLKNWQIPGGLSCAALNS
jgi:hypothetical protein